MKKILLLLPLITLAFTFGSYQPSKPKNHARFIMPPDVPANMYAPNTILFKLKDTDRPLQEMQRALELLNGIAPEKVFKNSVKPNIDFSVTGERLADISSIYRIKYKAPVSVEEAVNLILQTGEVEYAEPDYYRTLAFTPNDPSYSSQYHLSKIQAPQGWDIQKGDTNVVIAIIDSGTDIDHPDLSANFKRNYADTIDGVDNDGNGFTDDFIGWDFGGVDYNNPIDDEDADIKGVNNAHGSHVSGDASAVTDNSTGVSGAGFRCKLLPIKCASDNDTRGSGGAGLINSGYEGIRYAADMGADIINCSWGGNGRSQTEQEVIRYAAINKNALVVCAAGNNDNDRAFYPASYKFVLSVAATDGNDVKSSFSNYGNDVDVSAPGSGIFSTVYNDSYGEASGTSMASPITAGVCAIVKSQFPQLTGIQVGEKVRVTADNVNAVNSQLYQDRIGKGRVNMYKALTLSSPSVRMDTVTINDNNDNVFRTGDTLTITCTLKNWLDNVSGLNVSITAFNSPTWILEGSASVNSIPTFGTQSVTFKTRVNDASLNTKLIYKLNYTAGQYNDFEYFTVDVNPSYSDVTASKVKTTLNSRGNFVYNDFPENLQGRGFRFGNSDNLAFEGGLVCALSESRVSDVVRGSGDAQNSDFSIVEAFKITEPGVISRQDGIAKFKDQSAANKIGVEITMNSYAFDSAGFIILKYSIKNVSGGDLTGFYAGLFADWDIGTNGALNRASYNDSLQLGYAWRTDNNPSYHTGISLLSANNPTYWAIDNENGIQGNPFGIYDGFSDAEKYQSLSNRIGKRDAGGNNGRDISMITGSGPYSIKQDSIIEVGFALLAGENLQALLNNGRIAKTEYTDNFPVYTFDNTPATYKLSQNYPNPFNPQTTIEYFLQQDGQTKIEIFDMLGRRVTVLVDEFQKANAGGTFYRVEWNAGGLPSGVYFYRIISGGFEDTKKMVLVR